MSKEVFTGVKMALAGNFGEIWTKDKLKRFIVNNGGEVVEYKDKSMTHLLCTLKAYEERSYAVQEAMKRRNRLGAQSVKIVNFDWFEDSLQARRKKAVNANYDMKTFAKENRKMRKKRQAERHAAVDKDMQNFAKIVSDAKAQYNLFGYHCYVDPTGFEHNVVLSRANIWDNSNQKVILRLYASDEPPYSFACYSTSFTPDGKQAREVHALPGSQFEGAYKAFTEVFKDRTHFEWADRANAWSGLLPDGNKDHEAFVYRQPEHGSLGMDLPFGRNHDESLSDDLEDADESEQAGSRDTLVEDHRNTQTIEEQAYDTADEENSDTPQFDRTADFGIADNFKPTQPDPYATLIKQPLHTEYYNVAQSYQPVRVAAPSSGFKPININNLAYGQADGFNPAPAPAPVSAASHGFKPIDRNENTYAYGHGAMADVSTTLAPAASYDFNPIDGGDYGYAYGHGSAFDAVPAPAPEQKTGLVTWNWGGNH